MLADNCQTTSSALEDASLKVQFHYESETRIDMKEILSTLQMMLSNSE